MGFVLLWVFMYNAHSACEETGLSDSIAQQKGEISMIKRLTGQFNIIGKAALSTLAPSLYRLGFVLLGVIIGLAWAYQGAPIKFRDAEPVHLAAGYKDQWTKMTAVEYAETGDAEEARRKIVAGGISPSMIQTLIDANAVTEPELTRKLQALLVIAEENRSAASKQAQKIETGFLGGILGPLACIVGTAVIGVILSIFFTFYWAVPRQGLQRRRTEALSGATVPTGGAVSPAPTSILAAKRDAAKEKTDFTARGEVPPVCQFVSTYVLGDSLYDESFPIETSKGMFLGECGSSIGETIGVGEPKRVTATEVWLFDKNDITTVTKVIMSEHAYRDQALRTKLASKGEAVLAVPGATITLETQTLRAQVRIVDVQYGEGPLPPRSFFERLVVEIAVWSKEGAESGTGEPDASAAFGDTAELLNY